MHPDKIYKNVIHLCARNWVGLWLLFLLSVGASAATSADTLGSRYPGLSSGLLKSAVLTQLDNDTVLTAEGVTIKRSQLPEGIRNQEPKLRKDFPGKLNVVFVHVGEEQILAARYGIRSIPVQVFYDAKGQEVFRHVGFFAEKDVVDQLKKAGL